MNIFDLLFPKHCVGCGKIGKYFCKKCASSIKLIATNEVICPVCEKLAVGGVTHPRCRTSYTLDGLTSFFRYDGVVRQAIKSIKYRFVSDLAEEFVDLIPISYFSKLPINNYQLSTLVPIPLHSSRFRWRGFNQAEELGKILGKRLNVPLKKDLLRRVRKTIPQVEMKDRKKRLANMEGVFAISSYPPILQSPNLILFDDVFTTGATMRAAANVLKRAGVRQIWGVSMAR